jgi:alpha-amylase
MKRIFIFLFILVSLSATAKKVMFRVNMEGWPKDSTGIQVTGDFQDEAGFPADWDPGTTAMTQGVADTNIYWCVVDIPAFVHYEFKYVNGIHGYQQEFVPFESRVNYNFIDNRWFYLDSLSNDTLILPDVRFAGNAPAGKSLIRFYVDMTNETSVSPNGVHVKNDMNSFSAVAAHMFSFDGIAYEYIDYVDSGLTTTHEYKFANGNTAGNEELLAGWCANANGYRAIAAPRDTMLPIVCYTFCDLCSTVGMEESSAGNFSAWPNPAGEFVKLTFGTAEVRTISVVDFTGREVINLKSSEMTLTLNLESLAGGVYYIRSMNNSGSVRVEKVIVE